MLLDCFRCSEEPPESGASGRTEFHALRSLAPSAPLNALYSPLSPLAPLSRLSHLLSPLHWPSILSPSPSTFAALGLQASIASHCASRSDERGRESAVAVAGVGVSAASSAMCTVSSCGMPSHNERATSSQAAHRLSIASIFSVPRPSIAAVTATATATTATYSQTCGSDLQHVCCTAQNDYFVARCGRERVRPECRCGAQPTHDSAALERHSAQSAPISERAVPAERHKLAVRVESALKRTRVGRGQRRALEGPLERRSVSSCPGDGPGEGEGAEERERERANATRR